MSHQLRRNQLRLTERQLHILRLMAGGEDLVYEKGKGFVGDYEITERTLLALLQCCAISEQLGSVTGGFERYAINSTGKGILKERQRTCPEQPDMSNRT